MSTSIPSRPGHIVSALACERRVRVLFVMLDGPCEELRQRHHLGPAAARLGAEGLIAATLLSSQIKGEERLTVNLYGERPKFELMIDIWSDGRLRARFQPAQLEPVTRFRGLFAALKFMGNRELYRGVAGVEDEDVESALQRYFVRSVQVDGRVRVQVELDAEGRVSFAGGVLVERFPDMDAEEFAQLFDEPLRQDFRALMTGFAFGTLAGQPVEVLDHRDLLYRCPCSRPRVLSMLQSLGASELASMIEEDGKAEVTCHFCNTTWTVETPELASLLDELGSAVADEAN